MIYKFNESRKSLLARLRVSPAFLLALFITAIAIPTVQLAIRANSLSDTVAPQLTSLDAAQTAVDTSSAPVSVVLNGTFTDNLSGFGSAYFHYTSPTGNQVIEGTLSATGSNVSGAVQFPQYAETGEWTATVTLIDLATNSASYTSSELASLGDSAITISSSPSDTTAPTLDSLVFDVNGVDTTTGNGFFSGTVIATDNLSGIDFERSRIMFRSPSGTQTTNTIIEPLSGNTYFVNLVFNQYSELGNWTTSLVTVDKANNTRLYDTEELDLLGFPTIVNVTGIEDTTPPTIVDLSFSSSYPLIGDELPSSAKVTIFGEFADNISGFEKAYITYHSQSSTQVAPVIDIQNDPRFTQYTVFIPPFAASGVWLPEMRIVDHAQNSTTLSHQDLLNLGYNLAIDIAANEGGTAPADGTITTDVDNSGATVTEPFVAAVQTPVAGDINITQVSLNDPVSANDYLVFDQQYDISAPDATAEDPLQLTFRVDSSALQGQTAATVVVFRNGELVAECTDPVQAVPDPCVSARNTLPDGDVELTVRSSHASIWFLGYAAPTGPSYSFQRFKGVKSTPALNKEKSGSTVPVKFELGGDFGLDVLPAEIATSQQINCSSKTPIGTATSINTTGGGLKIHGDDEDEDEEEDENEQSDVRYKFNWKTMKNWKNTCRSLQLNFSNGEEVNAYFDFR